MKTNTIKLMILAWLAILCQSAFAVDYYFSSVSGDDNRTSVQAQNPATPWKSISKLNEVFPSLTGGDNIYFKRGERYYGTIHITSSGSPGNPIRIGAYGVGTKPMITSFVEVSGWNNLGNTIFESKAGLSTSEVKVVLLNGKRVELGRFPNPDADNEGYITISSTNGSNAVTGVFPSIANWQNGEIVIKKVQWVIDTHRITDHSGSTITFDNSGASYPPSPGFGFFLQNHPGTLDQYGEWYFNPSTRRIRVFFGNQNVSTASVEVATLPYLITKANRANHILLENLHLSGANQDAIFFGSNGDNVTIRGVDIAFTGENGMHILSHTNLLIDGNNVSSSYNNGMFLRFGNQGAVIRNNTLTDVATIPGRNANGDGSGVGIFAVSDNILIERNQVSAVGYNGIQFNGNNTVVRHNFVDTFCLTKGDGGGIYTYGGHNNPDVHNRKVEANIIINGIGSKGGLAYMTKSGFNPQAEGIFLDDNSNGIEIVGNTIANSNSGIKMSNSYNIQVRNNTIYNSNMLINIGNSNLGKDTRNVLIEGNTFFSNFEDQNAYTLRSHKNDISQMVSARNNTFFRPFGDEYSLYTRNPNSSGAFVENFYNLDRWQREMGKDLGSKSTTVEFEKFVVEKVTGSNAFPNQGFDRNVSGVSSNNSTLTWLKDGINGGTLQVATSSSGATLKIDIGQVNKERNYLVRFKSRATKKAPLRLYFRHSGSPWATISAMNTVELASETNEYQTILVPQIDLDKASLMIACSEGNITYLLDDLEIVPVEIHQVLPEEKIHFEFNPTASSKTIALNGTFINAQNNTVSGQVVIPPFGSVVLFRTGNDVVDAEEKAVEKVEEQEEIEEETSYPAKKAAGVPVSELFMNFGSDNGVEYEGVSFSGESLDYFVSATNVSNNPAASIEPMFQTGRFGSSLVMAIPVTNGTYTVKTYHHETFFGMNGRLGGPNRRVFDIAIQGMKVKESFDLFLENANQETVLTFHEILVTDNVLHIELTASVNNAIISGISILPWTGSQQPTTETGDEQRTTPPDVEPVHIVAVNTFRTSPVTYQHVEFVGQGDYLKTTNTGISTNTSASPEELFQAGRFATSLAYEIPVANGKYQVKTYHHETHFGKTGPAARKGQRVFDISVEGAIVKKDLDMFVEFNNKEVVLDHGEFEVRDNFLNIDLRASVNNAIISGFMVIPIIEPTVAPTPVGIYFSAGNQGNIAYGGNEFVRIPADYLKTSGTNVSSNTTASTEPLFRSGRFAQQFRYEIPVPNGVYTIETYHKETFFGLNGRIEQEGQRVFDISIEGVKVKSNFDMFAEFRNKEVKLVFRDILVKDGKLDLGFSASANNAIISAIGIVDETGKTLHAGQNLRGYTEMEVEGSAEGEVEIPAHLVNQSLENLTVYPNPANDYANVVINSEGELGYMLIHDMAGQLVKSIHPSDFLWTASGVITVPTFDIKSGVYVLGIYDAKGIIGRTRVIVQH
jgi:parallel beta-helix repeat protein